MTDSKANAMDADARRTIARLAADTLPRLIDRLTRSELGEIEVRDDGWRIRLRRPIDGIALEGPVAARPADTRAAAAAAARDGHADRGARPARGVSHDSRTDIGARGVVTSPAVGYYQTRDGVVVGYKVGRGDLLGYVDVLGMRQEVVAPVEGVVGALAVESGEAIEFGQQIARIDPAGSPADMKVEA